MGEVHRARDPRLGREVAIKVLPELYSRDPDRLRRFEQEARAASALNHPGILTVYDIGSHKGAPYVVAELLEGQTLRERIATNLLPTRKALDYAIQMANGLAAAHEKGIVHRDLKPENAGSEDPAYRSASFRTIERQCPIEEGNHVLLEADGHVVRVVARVDLEVVRQGVARKQVVHPAGANA